MKGLKSVTPRHIPQKWMNKYLKAKILKQKFCKIKHHINSMSKNSALKLWDTFVKCVSKTKAMKNM